jgi:hypothetical protein
MNRNYIGYELLKEIACGKIKNNTLFMVNLGYDDEILVSFTNNELQVIKHNEQELYGDNNLMHIYSLWVIINMNFQLVYNATDETKIEHQLFQLKIDIADLKKDLENLKNKLE